LINLSGDENTAPGTDNLVDFKFINYNVNIQFILQIIIETHAVVA
jgi:hypothetical protein